MSIIRSKWFPLQSFSARTCVLLSVLVHLGLFCLPFEQSKVEAMPGSMSMAFVSGTGEAGQGGATVGPDTLKAIAKSKVEQSQKNKNTSATRQKPVVQPKPVPKPRRRPSIPLLSKNKQAVRQVSVATVTPKPMAKSQKDVEEKSVAESATEKPPTRGAAVHTIQPLKGKAPEKAQDSDEKKVLAPASSGEKTNLEANVSTGHGGTQQTQSAGGHASQGPMLARIGSLFGPKITRWIRPKYPRKARDIGQTGLVVLRITIDSLGCPTRVEVVQKAGSGFDEAAVAAVKRSSFTPAMHEGHPVACIALLPIHFNLKGN